MSANRDAKIEVVNEIKNNFSSACSVVFANYNGITVEEDTKLRKQARENGIIYKVYKNRLMLIALKELGIDGFDPKNLEGTTSVAIAKDEVGAAKLIGEMGEKFKKLDIKFGILNGKVLAKEEVEKLSKVPDKHTLMAMLVRGLTGPISSLARALNAVAEKQN